MNVSFFSICIHYRYIEKQRFTHTHTEFIEHYQRSDGDNCRHVILEELFSVEYEEFLIYHTFDMDPVEKQRVATLKLQVNLGGNVVLRLAISVLFVAPGGNRGPVRQGRAKEGGHHARVEQFDDWRERQSLGRLIG